MKNIMPIQNNFSDEYLLVSNNTHKVNIQNQVKEVWTWYKNIQTLSDFCDWLIALIANLWLFIGQWDARDMYLVDSQGTKYEDGVFIGTPVISCNHGVVIDSGYNEAAGNYVIVSQKDAYVLYAHLLDGSIIKPNQFVLQGQRIGLAGSTGNSTGPHLHIGFYWNDPRTFNWKGGIGKSFSGFETRKGINLETGETQLINSDQVSDLEIIK